MGVRHGQKRLELGQHGALKKWHNLRRGCGSKHGDSGGSGYGWDRAVERVKVVAPHPHLPYPTFQRRRRRRRGASGRRSSPQSSLPGKIMDIGEAEVLEKSCLVGRGHPILVVVVCGHDYDRQIVLPAALNRTVTVSPLSRSEHKRLTTHNAAPESLSCSAH